ncbi:Spo0E family sporulation regulatory protein-aspartic acid phosphatase [Fictibacillus sp. WQ 8-8]|uniref:Spo0E family sporulation regulatory protein-aspartic acid phosphatase n=1 Tax=unclassified Fictibacillus TaxID=2644029 RepID=UPI0008E5867A|nr:MULTISPECIES: Spo0E family sporulation regulatory protein-aspartic acid phosphatase [unclassified Fictibacillus]MCQ6264837.1 Spo0E family sporulation regulatory protein-aspartic acid phosphatase [Fictibacillus sp. WQ 8-8]MED2970811.1 Spo0E family sporulation regulatory protein-aspartic acid phosphatase [Fictibacillus sp. B-59209]UZJ79242.1 Spo0E family sporulation regulatory protein-aspartic acid phosphatase [Fictibacillus sp. KU28468]SFE87376.1 Spo0E like sporulation regulatory protein [Bac
MTHQNIIKLKLEIDAIRLTMYVMSTRVNNLADPLLVQLSQLLDQKLNELNQCA